MMKLDRNDKTKKAYHSVKRGFSLLEVIIALFVLSIGIVGMLSLISTSIKNSNEARDIVVASQLAQEGVELVRNERDTNILSDPTDAFVGLGAGVCRADAIDGLTCPSASFGLNYSADAGGVYRFLHSAGTATKFSRKIVISGSGMDRTVRSLVFWGGGWGTPPLDDGSDCLNIKECVYAETVLTDWAQE